MRVKFLLSIAVVAALGIYPLLTGPYYISMMLLIFMYICLSSGWNIISGYTGYVSLGHSAFFGMGAYVAALQITKWGVHWFPAALVGGLAAVVLALPTGILCLRLRGPYFAIFMIGLNELMAILASIFEGVTGGAMGLTLPIVRNITGVYYGMGAVALSAVLLTFWIDSGRFGLRLLAIREDETAADMLGTNTSLYKLIAFLLSSFFPGAAGGIYAWYISYIDPETVFDIFLSIQMVLMCILGGRGTPLGPVIGAATLYIITEFTWANFPEFHRFAFGALIVLVLLFAPRGIVGLLVSRGFAHLRSAFRD